MRNIKCIIITAVVVLLWGQSCVGAIADDKETLRGLKGMEVVVESLHSPEVEKLGLNVKMLQTDVELKLRMAGIKVLSGKEALDIPGMPFLEVNANLMPKNIGFCLNVSISLHQTVILESNPELRCSAITWSEEGVGSSSNKELAKHVRNIVKDQVDIFINDYLSVNPINPTAPKGGK